MIYVCIFLCTSMALHWVSGKQGSSLRHGRYRDNPLHFHIKPSKADQPCVLVLFPLKCLPFKASACFSFLGFGYPVSSSEFYVYHL